MGVEPARLQAFAQAQPGAVQQHPQVGRGDGQFLADFVRVQFQPFAHHADETGTGAGAGFNLNLPLPAGCTAARWFEALEAACLRIASFKPDALVVSLGLDTFAGDPISKFALQPDDFIRLGERLGKLGLPTVFVLEGGYAAAELGTNAVNVIEGFEGR